MIGLSVKAAKAGFLDRAAVMRAVDRGRRRSLAKSGAFIRTTARRSMRRRRGPSRPGRPPHAHAGLLRDLLYFSFDGATDSVVVGPAAISKGGEAPPVLEFGGRVRKPDYWRGPARLITIRARPYMGPALRKARERLAGDWKDQIR